MKPGNESTPWCPFGWTPPPRADGGYELPQPPPELNCTALPCPLAPDSPYLAGQTQLFDVVADPYERHDVAAQHPALVANMTARLEVLMAGVFEGQKPDLPKGQSVCAATTANGGYLTPSDYGL